MAAVNNPHTEPEFDHDSGSRGPAGRGRPTFGLREDPLTWSFPIPLLRLLSLRIRVHAIVPIWAGAEMVASLPQGNMGSLHKACVVISLLLVSLVREGLRGCLARRLGSDVDHVTIWPVGGLTPVVRPGTTRPILAEAGGLAASLALVPVLGGAALLAGASPSMLYELNPLAPSATATALRSGWLIAAWWAYYANLLILAVNLLPMFPLDGGRILQAWLRERSGRRAMGGALAASEIATKAGLFIALLLFVLAATAQQTRLIALAAFCALATWMEYRRGEFVARPEVADPATAIERQSPPASGVTPSGRAGGLELDAVLSKISREGLQSLNQAERGVLARETERRRRG